MRRSRGFILLGLAALLAVVVWIIWPQPPPLIKFTANPATITAGGPSTLVWEAPNVTSAVIDNGVGAQGVEGSVVVRPETTTTYTLTAIGPGGKTFIARTTVTLAPPPQQKVAVVTRDLFWGTILMAEMLKLEPETSLPEVYRSKIRGLEECLPETTARLGDCYFSDPKSLADRFLLTDLKTHEPILASESTDRGIPGVTRQRAMAVKVDTIVGVAGFIKPGNRVDVLVTLRESPPVTKVILQNVLVLATGVTMERKGNEREPSQVNVITLEVDPVEAEKLALASNQGELRLTLRNFQDVNRVPTPGATIPSLLASDRLQERLRTGQTVKRRTVEVIKGGQVETKTLE